MRKRGLLSIRYRSYGSLIYPIKSMWFLPNCPCANAIIWIHHMDANNTHREKTQMRTTQECHELFWTNLGNNSHLNKTSATRHNEHYWKIKDELIFAVLRFKSTLCGHMILFGVPARSGGSLINSCPQRDFDDDEDDDIMSSNPNTKWTWQLLLY